MPTQAFRSRMALRTHKALQLRRAAAATVMDTRLLLCKRLPAAPHSAHTCNPLHAAHVQRRLPADLHPQVPAPNAVMWNSSCTPAVTPCGKQAGSGTTPLPCRFMHPHVPAASTQRPWGASSRLVTALSNPMYFRCNNIGWATAGPQGAGSPPLGEGSQKTAHVSVPAERVLKSS